MESPTRAWDHSWVAADGTFKSRHSINGTELEPVHSMFMALQFHLWGSNKLGYDLNFEVGARDANMIGAQRRNGRFPLLSDRVVAAHLPDVVYQDADGNSHSYSDCYRVDLTIKYDPNQ